MKRWIAHLSLIFLLALQLMPVSARSGDTLEPIQITPVPLETYPDNLLAESDFEKIEERTREARNAGVPVAVRIVDMTQETTSLPFPIRKYARDDFSQPMSAERKQAIGQAWADQEAIESSPDANDGFLLLVLVPEDRTQTQAIWWVGPNALPINGLTQDNIDATHNVMNAQFAEGNMPNGVYLGLSEFSYNVQFGESERLERTKVGDALHTAVLPLAAVTALAGVSVPLVAWWLARKNNFAEEIDLELTPWQAAALAHNRATGSITTAMLLDAMHTGHLTPGNDGSVKISSEPGNAALEALRPLANADGIVSAEAMAEVEALTFDVREQIEDDLAASGAMTSRVKVDRTWMLLAMGVAVIAAVMTTIPSVVSKSAAGVFAIAIAIFGAVIGWWWLTHRSYTSPAGEKLLRSWLDDASNEERQQYDTATNLDLFTDQIGGPDINHQTRLVRQLHGLGAG